VLGPFSARGGEGVYFSVQAEEDLPDPFEIFSKVFDKLDKLVS
jgi:hypothetical protein